MKVIDLTDQAAPGKQICLVVVVYEDDTTRQRAMCACDFLIQELWSEVEFDFQWWRTDFLENSVMGQTAAAQAAHADFVIVAGSAERELPVALKSWFESWIEARQGRDGALLSLTTSDLPNAEPARRTALFLREVARRAMLDYFETAPQTSAGGLPASYEAAQLKANPISSVLDDSLNQPRPASFGLND